MTHAVLDDALFAAMESSILPTEQAESLPPLCYTSAEFYEFEKDAVFAREWLCVGRDSWAPEPGSYFTSFIADEPIVVARGRDGVLRAMSSVCQHRGMLVAEGCGKTRAFVCPYHHWTYTLDGTLAAAPAMEKSCGFDKSKASLPLFAVEIWEGFVFINFDREAAPLAPRLAKVTEILKPYGMADAEGEKPSGEQRYPWNWKVMFENNNDGYHASKLHQGPLHDFIPSELAEFPDDLPDDTAGYYRTNRTLHPDASFNATQRAVLPVFTGLTDDERHRMVFANLPPTLSLVMTADAVIYLILRADGPESHRVDQGVLTAPGSSADPAFRHKMAMNMQAAGEIIDQDLHVDELVQVGLRSRFAPRGRYSWQEGAQRLFNSWLVPRYREAWARQQRG
ncbi:aromatic ring-hydroxylating oxygenase subunit alpha [Tanticharoenia sakaeratensis]|uniref:Dioxygenase subunit alpha yeaW n=1 Tax=Tanticharoenia sakaeratensis NBRC 103193 TaxID=1231623 RepID=A0A0D6MQR2_9PROT|nr:SRPBCC family protein [Tanticharoenia sakaeratensis]GAN55771.1 dioxygenase subunit alpha yeaW [Tanticharoenia sakaeratensis NBRC 103193]GBQ18593.1 Rieske 2Fe-2S domain-containing protein [Tanticharoenia sakaeratensis NBRC 103193]